MRVARVGVGRRHRRVAARCRGAPQRKSRRAARAAPRRGLRTRRRPGGCGDSHASRGRRYSASGRRPRAPPRRRRARRARTGGTRWRAGPRFPVRFGSVPVFPVRFGSAGFAAEASSTDDPSDTTTTEDDRGKRAEDVRGETRRVPSAKTRAMRADFVELLVASGSGGAQSVSLRALRSTEGTGGARPGHHRRGTSSPRGAHRRARARPGARTPGSGGARDRRRRRRANRRRARLVLGLGLVGGRRISRRESHRRARGDGAGGSSHASHVRLAAHGG